MPVVAIIYGRESGIIRRFVACDSLAELGAGKHYGDGEEMMLLPPDDVMKRAPGEAPKPDLYRAMDLVAEKRGAPAETARCLVIDQQSGEVESVIMADPILDWLADKTLYQHDDADVGYVLDEDGEFQKPAEIEPQGEIAASIDKDGG